MSEELNAQPQANENSAPDAQQVDNAVTQAQQEQKQPEKIKVKFNHAEQEIPLDEAVALIQKGMNYDKTKARLDELESDAANKLIGKLAKDSGMSREEFVKAWEHQTRQAKINEMAEREGIDVTIAERLYDAEVLKKEQEAEKRQKDIEKETKIQQDQRLEREEAEFHAAYPDVKARSVEEGFPKEVLEQWGNGIPLTVAYQAWERGQYAQRVKELETQLNAKATNTANADTSMGSAQTNGEGHPVALTDESVSKMTREERQKRMPEILKMIASGKIKA